MQKKQNKQTKKPIKKTKNNAKKRQNRNGTMVSINETKVLKSQNPNRNPTFTVRKKEYLRDLVRDPSGADRFEKQQINPGIKSSFPWASIVSRGFERYRFKRLVIIYEPSASTIVPGVVAIAPEFNADLNMPTTKIDLFQYQYLHRATPYKRFEYDLLLPDTKVLQWMYLRRGPLAVGQDVQLFDPMYLILFSGGIVGDTFVSNKFGELWIDYEIEFKNMQIPPYILQLAPIKIFSISGAKPSVLNGTSAESQGGILPITWVSAGGSGYFYLNEPFRGILNYEIQFTETTVQINPILFNWQANCGFFSIVSTPAPSTSFGDSEYRIGRFGGTFETVGISGSITIVANTPCELNIASIPLFPVVLSNDNPFTNYRWTFISYNY